MSERICFRDDFPCVFKVYEGNNNIHVFPSSFLRLPLFGLLLGVEDTGHVAIENCLINLSLSLFHLFLCRFVHIVLRQLCLLHRVRARLGQFLVSVSGVACLPTFWQSILITIKDYRYSFVMIEIYWIETLRSQIEKNSRFKAAEKLSYEYSTVYMLHNAKRNSFEMRLSETTNQSRYSVWQIWRNWNWFLYPMLYMQKTWSAVTSVNAPSLVKWSNTRQKHLLQPSQAHCWSNTGKCRELIRLMTTSGTSIVNCWRGRDSSR